MFSFMIHLKFERRCNTSNLKNVTTILYAGCLPSRVNVNEVLSLDLGNKFGDAEAKGLVNMATKSLDSEHIGVNHKRRPIETKLDSKVSSIESKLNDKKSTHKHICL